jgi:hypothetical protein
VVFNAKTYLEHLLKGELTAKRHALHVHMTHAPRRAEFEAKPACPA